MGSLDLACKTIDVVEFTQFPAGRYRTDGPKSGEAFREDLLLPALRQGPVRILLDGTMGYGASFLEETFGGLVRAGFTAKALEENMTLEASDPSLIEEAWRYVTAAGATVDRESNECRPKG